MRITATVPDDIGKEVKEKTDNVSAFVAEALEEKLARMRQQEARENLLELAGTEEFSEDVLQILQQERRESGRV